ncbi:MAG: metal ABC transporter ATP-binding protein [Mycetocola sp.]
MRVSNLTVSYGATRALSDVSTVISAGLVTAVIGTNGSGKSTLFRSIVGEITAQSGAVTVGGRVPAVARRAGLIASVPQSERVDWTFPLSVREVVMMGRYGHMGPLRRPRRRDQDAVSEALARVQLGDLGGRQIGELSGGQRKRVFVARGLAQEASVLLLDEPFAGVDVRSQSLMTAVMREVAADGAAVVVSTHDLAGVQDLADRALLLNGRVVAQGAVADVVTVDNLAAVFGLGVAPGVPGHNERQTGGNGHDEERNA